MVHEHDHECGCGHHHHDEDTEHLHTNKYQQAFAKFEAAGTTEEVTGRVKTLLGKQDRKSTRLNSSHPSSSRMPSSA